MNIVDLDIETTPIKDWSRPTDCDILCVAVICKNKFWEFEHVYTGSEIVEVLPDILASADMIRGHNIIAFDMPVLKAKLPDLKLKPGVEIVDTLVLSRLDNPDRKRMDGSSKTPHSIDAWGEWLGVPKSTFDDFTEYSPELGERCLIDTKIGRDIGEVLYPKLMKQCPDAVRLEMRIAEMIAQQAWDGVVLDQDLARSLIEQIEEQLATIEQELDENGPVYVIADKKFLEPFKINGEVIKRVSNWCEQNEIPEQYVAGPFESFRYESINWSSPVQVKRYLLSIGWQPSEFTEKGSPKLEGLQELGRIGQLLEERSKKSHKLATIKGLLSSVREDGTVPAMANSLGTNTGRMTHKVVVNMPKASKYPKTHPKAGQLVWMDDLEYQKPLYGTEMRALFIAREGRVLFGYDATALELRILAHYINNEKYTRVVAYEDPHEFAQREASLPTRDNGKTLNYALIFGARDKRIGSIVGGGAREGSDIRQRLYSAIPGFKELNDAVENSSKKGWLKGLDGRKLMIRPHKSPMNTLIQGGGAVAMKTVAYTMDKLMSPSLKETSTRVIDMHDEGQWDILEKNALAMQKLVDQAFAITTDTLQLNCPLVGECRWGANWAETH